MKLVNPLSAALLAACVFALSPAHADSSMELSAQSDEQIGGGDGTDGTTITVDSQGSGISDPTSNCDDNSVATGAVRC